MAGSHGIYFFTSDWSQDCFDLSHVAYSSWHRLLCKIWQGETGWLKWTFEDCLDYLKLTGDQFYEVVDEFKRKRTCEVEITEEEVESDPQLDLLRVEANLKQNEAKRSKIFVKFTCRRFLKKKIHDEHLRELRSEAGRIGGEKSGATRRSKRSLPILTLPNLTKSSTEEYPATNKKDKNPSSDRERSDDQALSDCPKKQRKPKAPPPQEAIDIANHLAAKIMARIPDGIPPSLKRGAEAARLLHQVDGKSWQEIYEMINWCQADPFWQSNILSMDKLRQKWLILKDRKAKGLRLVSGARRVPGTFVG